MVVVLVDHLGVVHQEVGLREPEVVRVPGLIGPAAEEAAAAEAAAEAAATAAVGRVVHGGKRSSRILLSFSTAFAGHAILPRISPFLP
jgi:hypothetical protein